MRKVFLKRYNFFPSKASFVLIFSAIFEINTEKNVSDILMFKDKNVYILNICILNCINYMYNKFHAFNNCL